MIAIHQQSNARAIQKELQTLTIEALHVEAYR